MIGHHHGDHVLAIILHLMPIAAAILIYAVSAIATSQKYSPITPFRYSCWILGVVAVSVSWMGPLANRAHTDFAAHMTVHLLLGMLSPLLLLLSAPITLLLRSLRINQARSLSRILKSAPMRLINHPPVTATLHIGGLWLLYTTDLYHRMHQSFALHFIVHLHMILAGYLFTASMIYMDPVPHRTSFAYRTFVLLVALTGHGILSKYIYAHPPAGVPAAQAEAGSLIMYYGGDLVDLVLIFILFLQWFQAARPKSTYAYKYS